MYKYVDMPLECDVLTFQVLSAHTTLIHISWLQDRDRQTDMER